MTKTPEPSGAPRRALGRGLSALLPGRETPGLEAPAATSGGSGQQLHQIPVGRIDPNPYQPRRVFQEDRLQELAQSIRSDGVIQPLVVRENGSRYTLIVGERRLRAAKLAGLAEVPAMIQNIPADRLLEVTLIENIQREDLNPIETALAFERMARELNSSHEEIARRTGKERSTITNLLRLLKLPADVQQLVADGRLSTGHARAILALEQEEAQRKAAETAVKQGLSVRQVERLVQRMTERPALRARKAPPLDPNMAAAVQDMEQILGTRVRVVGTGPNQGRIEIDYYSVDDLDRIYGVIVHR